MRRTITEAILEQNEARWWHVEGNSVVCDLCPHACVMSEGEMGDCLARANIHGTLRSLNYGRICASQVDSIEKKPAFHFEPGARLLSIGTFGCNLDCDYCQNYGLSRPEGEVPCRTASPSDIVKEAQAKGVKGIAFTYNEPTVWSEYIIDVAAEAHPAGLFIFLNTNGYIQEKAAEDLLLNVDAVKVDIKGFDENVYRSTNGGSLGPVLRTCETAKRLGVHLELSYLMIPQVTDRQEHLRPFAEWVMKEIGRDTPVHLFRFQPEFRMVDSMPESVERMEEAARMMKDMGLVHVYLGGMVGETERNTYCSRCGELLIEREQEKREPVIVQKKEMSRFCPSFSNVRLHLENQACPRCQTVLNVKRWHG